MNLNFEKEIALSSLLKNANVLVIDDFQGMRTTLRNIIKDMGGVKIDTASNGREAINQLRLIRYDIVICDYNLGDGPNGQHILEEAKINNLIGPAAVWIMVTAEKTTDMVMGAAEIKPDDYILKPINQEMLENRLERLINRKKSLSAIETVIKSKNYQAALDECDKLIQTKPANLPEVLRIKTDVLMTLGRYDEAVQIFESVLAQRSVPWAKTGLGKVLYHTKDYVGAQRVFKDVLAENRIYMEAYDWLVKTLRAMGDTRQAQQVLQNALQLSPNSANRQKTLGETAYLNGDLDLAQTAYEKTIKISEHSPHKSASVYAGLAKVFSEKDDPNAALKVLDQGKKEFKDSNAAALETSIVESMVYQKMGDPAKAQQAMAQAQQLRKSMGNALDADLTMEMANALFKLGDKTAASAMLGDLVKNNHDSTAVTARVQALFEQAEMGEEGKTLIQDARQQVININNQGVALGRDGKLSEAIELLRKAHQELPNSETIMMNLCGLLIVFMRKTGRSESLMVEIRNLLNRVHSINPSNKKHHEYTTVLNSMRAD